MTEQIRPPAECQYWAVQMWLGSGNAYIWNRIRSSYTTDTRGRLNLAGQMEQWIQDAIDWIWKIEIMIWCNTIIHRFPTRRRINRCQATGSMKYIFVFYNFWTLRWNTGHQQPWNWVCKVGRSVSSTRNDRKYMQVFTIIRRGRHRPADLTYPISWLLMPWRRKELRHHKPWYWPSFPGTFQ